METRELICIQCPIGCPLKVELEGDKILSVTGNTCKRGLTYAEKEITAPARTVTSTVNLVGSTLPVLPVRTSNDIPKNKIFDCMKLINEVSVNAPIKIGDIIIENVCGTGMNVISTANAVLI